MKKIVSLMIVLFLLITAVTALEIREGDEIIIEDDLNESLYAAGGTISIEGKIGGDVTAFGGSININDEVRNDIMACGGQVSINSQIMGSAHVCGGDVNINAPIGADLFTVGGNININSVINGDIRALGGNININGRVTGDVLVLGGNVVVNGPVSGSIAATAGELSINGVVEGDVTVDAGKIKLGKDALIKGDLNYTSKDAEFKEEQIEGLILKGVVKKRVPSYVNMLNLKIFGALTLLLVSIILVLIIPNTSRKLSNIIRNDFWKTLLFGFIALIVVPFAIIILMLTLIGIPVALIVLLLYILALYLSKIFAALFVGRLIFTDEKTNILMPLIVGMIIYLVFANIPFIGGLVKLIATLLGLGAMTMMIFTDKKKRGIKHY